jgi:hypothetical protein
MLDQDDAKKIAAKLNAQTKPGRRHDLVVVRHKGKYVTQYGIRRGSRGQPHSYIPRQLFISQGQARNLSDCPMSADEYFKTLLEKGHLPGA